jgi:hypothetical protein
MLESMPERPSGGHDLPARSDGEGAVDRLSEYFEVEVDLGPEEVLERFKSHGGVQWHEREPLGWRWQGAPDFQAWPGPRSEDGTRVGFYVRTFVTESADVQPPVLLVQATPTAAGSRVTATFLKHPRRKNNIYRSAMWASGVFGMLGAVYSLVLGGLAGDPMMYVNAIVYTAVGLGGMPLMAALARQANRPTPRSMGVYGRGIWQLVGQVFVPHMLGEPGDNPFRHRALPG